MPFHFCRGAVGDHPGKSAPVMGSPLSWAPIPQHQGKYILHNPWPELLWKDEPGKVLGS